MRNGILGLVVTVMLTASVTTDAAILFDTGEPLTFNYAYHTVSAIVAGQFTVTENATLTGAGVYVIGTSERPNLEGWAGTLEYFLYADGYGPYPFYDRHIPRALLASGNGLNVVATDTGLPVGGSSRGSFWLLEFDFDQGFGVTDGVAYWLGIHTASDYSYGLGLSWLGLNVAASGALFAIQDQGVGDFFWDYPNRGVTMFIEGVVGCGSDCHPSEIPEPGTLALLSIGLAGLGLSRRRKAN